MVHSMDLHAVALPDGALSMEAVADKAIVISLKNIGITMVVLPNEFLHTLQADMIVEVKVQE